MIGFALLYNVKILVERAFEYFTRPIFIDIELKEQNVIDARSYRLIIRY